MNQELFNLRWRTFWRHKRLDFLATTAVVGLIVGISLYYGSYVGLGIGPLVLFWIGANMFFPDQLIPPTDAEEDEIIKTVTEYKQSPRYQRTQKLKRILHG